MSAWKEWQIALKNGDTERAEEAKRDYESECRAEAKRDADMYWEDMYDDSDYDEGEDY